MKRLIILIASILMAVVVLLSLVINTQKLPVINTRTEIIVNLLGEDYNRFEVKSITSSDHDIVHYEIKLDEDSIDLYVIKGIWQNEHGYCYSLLQTFPRVMFNLHEHSLISSGKDINSYGLVYYLSTYHNPVAQDGVSHFIFTNTLDYCVVIKEDGYAKTNRLEIVDAIRR
ncbi:MAG: hypothetical protein NZM04_05435 [Methylacidiphilales bacterium]|nr:hypothetical protein [Candidatus Methylacidiphilales bacterium]